MPFGEFESRVDKKGQAILTLGTTTLWISVNSLSLGQELPKVVSPRRHVGREKLKARGRDGHAFLGKSIPITREGREIVQVPDGIIFPINSVRDAARASRIVCRHKGG